MKKRHHHSYIVTFCSSSGAESGSSTSICSSSTAAADNTTTPSSAAFSTPLAMERKQDSSTDLLLNTDESKEQGHSENATSIMVGRGCAVPPTSASLARIRDKFRGCLLGALVGDCVGTLFERDYSVNYKLLENLYHSLTNLSEDEKLMDLHGIDLTLEPRRIREILDIKRQSYASGILTSGGGGGGVSAVEDDADLGKRLSKKASNESMHPRRNSALAGGTPVTIALTPHEVSGGSRRGSFSRPIERYSDDTVMTKSVLYSLIACKGLDARHLAKQLTEDYFLNMNRKFGGYIRDIFVQLRESGYQDPYNPAKKCSGGIGAQGNEAASRVSPIALFCCWSLQDNQHQVLVDLASKMSKITNAHKASVHGTVLQALAVHAAFNWELQMERGKCKECGGGAGGGESGDGLINSAAATGGSSASGSRHGSPLLVRRRGSLHHSTRNSLAEVHPGVLVEQQPKYFCEQVLERMCVVEGRASSLFENLKHLVHHRVSGTSDLLKAAEPTYCDKLRTILEFLQRSQPPTRIEIVERLGNGFKAIDSVPTAVYSFLFSSKNEMLPEMSTSIKSPVLRSIFHAISLGGETDTLASMAGAIAGAYWGVSRIPDEILRVCEGSADIVKLADELFNVILKNKIMTGSGKLCQSCHQTYK